MRAPRWSVSGIKVKTFKSVGRTPVEVSFSRGLTCIVGPNGSGKSNLLDAVCFACGCSPTVLGVQRLADLQCTDVQEVGQDCLPLSWVFAHLLPQSCWVPTNTLASYTLLIGVQVCEVSVDVTNSADGRSYTVQCALVQESGRVYRLDGKLKTGKEIKVSAATLNRVCVMNTQPARICTILSW